MWKIRAMTRQDDDDGLDPHSQSLHEVFSVVARTPMAPGPCMRGGRARPRQHTQMAMPSNGRHHQNNHSSPRTAPEAPNARAAREEGACAVMLPWEARLACQDVVKSHKCPSSSPPRRASMTRKQAVVALIRDLSPTTRLALALPPPRLAPGFPRPPVCLWGKK